jgi:alpha-mannosidase
VEDDRDSWAPALPILKGLLAQEPAAVTHELSAIGHAHIDTAWLWPLEETYRKCVRSFSSAVRYMDDYPEYKFACSQAWQYQWIRDRNPDLYARIREKIAAGQWIVVGGTWVEPDCNLPSGEALCRQFIYGQRFFEREFGRRCNEFWNPDVFGYNGQLPQIMRQAGISRFLTQKLSWNRFNQPPHHTFLWRGIDGSEVLAHFPPADTYNAIPSAQGLRDNVRKHKDHDRSNESFMLFGYGDGGGGPTRDMLEQIRRAANLQGLPRTAIRSSDAFFDRLEADCTDLATAVGELYFEYHRGTYTTQAATKRGNRKSEWLLHDIECIAALARRTGSDHAYPSAELDALWGLVLLNQFHDILPGSSITLVYEDTERQYAEIAARGGALREAGLSALAGALGKGNGVAPFNTLGVCRRELIAAPDGALVVVDAAAYGVGSIVEDTADRVTLSDDGETLTLANAALTAVFSRTGELRPLVHAESGRDAMAAPGNVLEIYDDVPTNYDAWDIDPYALETGRPSGAATDCQAARSGPQRAEITFTYSIGANSSMSQTVRLDAEATRLEFHCDVDWHESHKLLKVAFPVDVRAMNATYEMQFGVVERPTHYTNSFDLAKYEVPAHRWADLSEHGFGVAMLSESKYGFNTVDNVMRMTLLRSPKLPDPEADMGTHHFAWALYPHLGGWQESGVVAAGLAFNVPLQWLPAAAAPCSLISADSPHLVVDTVKKAEDDDALVVRLYETHGARGTARLRFGFPVGRATFTNLLEDAGDAAELVDGEVVVPFTPFQLITVKVE